MCKDAKLGWLFALEFLHIHLTCWPCHTYRFPEVNYVKLSTTITNYLWCTKPQISFLCNVWVYFKDGRPKITVQSQTALHGTHWHLVEAQNSISICKNSMLYNISQELYKSFLQLGYWPLSELECISWRQKFHFTFSVKFVQKILCIKCYNSLHVMVN